jgi:hypothetical protein
VIKELTLKAVSLPPLTSLPTALLRVSIVAINTPRTFSIIIIIIKSVALLWIP